MHEPKYIEETPLTHRKHFGQFFTPPLVARLMAKWVIKNNPKSILDPAFGLGVFYDEISKLISKHNFHFTGYEIDSNIFKYIKKKEVIKNQFILNDDYLQADLESFDGIICNPPYMRFQKFLNRHHVLPNIENKIGKKLIGYANISSVFLIKALKELNIDGNLAFIMPFEFFNTGYGKEIKKSLLENNLLKQIIIFSNEKELFPNATTTVCVLLCKNDGKEETIKITQIKSNMGIDKIKDISEFYQQRINSSELPYNKKWTPIILSLFSKEEIPKDLCNLSFYGTVTRGIATGANEFFALTKSTINKWKIININTCKCITKSSQIQKAIFTETDFNKLSNADRPVYCLSVKDQSDENTQNYIEDGEKHGYNKRYLTRTRTNWFEIENRTPAPILFGVFNRGRLKVIRNYTPTITFTCFHSFYPNLYGKQVLDKLFIFFLSNIGQKIISNNKRSYGDELDKFEPGDLKECLCPNMKHFELINEEEVQKVIELAKTNEKAAIQICNKLINQIIYLQPK